MTDTIWSYADIIESVARAIPQEPAVIQGEKVLPWGEMDRQADALAQYFLNEGLGQGAKVAVYTMNCAEYLVGYYAASKLGMAPYNVNYRYSAEEIAYILDNGDAEAVIYQAQYNDVAAKARELCPRVKLWVCIADDGEQVPQWAVSYDDAVKTQPAQQPVTPPWGRSNDDMLMIYTGGTTGMPKGVMWRQSDLIGKGGYGGNPIIGIPPLESPAEAGPRAASMPLRTCSLIAPPLMHGTGLLTAIGAHIAGGCVLLLPQGKFSPETLWDMVEQHKGNRMAIVGNPFAQPMLEALDANPGRWDLSSMLTIISSGAMWNRENKQGMLKHMPQVMLMDAFSSSEALGMGTSITTKDNEVTTASFELGPDCAVFTEDGRRVEPGSAERGRVAVSGFLPIGYYKDEKKTAETFPTIEGRRWSIPGDWAEVKADGTLVLLGRGSQCINTGGEKVFPEEVEEVLKRHDAVRDAGVTSVPDARFGERIVALVELTEGVELPSEQILAEHVREHLAGYKVPRHFLIVDSVNRAPNGKMDYKSVKQRALDAFGETAKAS